MAGFTIDAALLGSLSDLRAELVGRTLLYWWPADGYSRMPLPARRLLARGRLHTKDVGAELHHRHTP